MQEKEWWSKYLCDTVFSPRWILEKDVEKILKEHKERIIKEIEGMSADHVKNGKNITHDKDEFWGCCECYEDSSYNAALDAVINHLKK